MAGRIRTVKPELIAAPKFAELSDAATRAFYGLLALVDDCGRCPAGASYLHGQIFYMQKRSAASVGKLLAELEAAGWVRRYAAKVDPSSRTAGEYLEIVGWSEKGSVTYQRVEKHQGERYPAPEPNRSGNGSGNDSVTDPISDPISDLDPEGESREEGEAEGEREGKRPAPPPNTTAIAVDQRAGPWEPAAGEENRKAAERARKVGINVQHVLEKFTGSARFAKYPTEEKRNLGWREWLEREDPPRSAERRLIYRFAVCVNLDDLEPEQRAWVAAQRTHMVAPSAYWIFSQFANAAAMKRYDDGGDTEGDDHHHVVVRTNGLMRLSCGEQGYPDDFEDDLALDAERKGAA
jgi:hypothetical protein